MSNRGWETREKGFSFSIVSAGISLSLFLTPIINFTIIYTHQVYDYMIWNFCRLINPFINQRFVVYHKIYVKDYCTTNYNTYRLTKRHPLIKTGCSAPNVGNGDEITKEWSTKIRSENICKLLRGGKKENMNVAKSNFVTNEVKVHFHMLGLGEPGLRRDKQQLHGRIRQIH